MILDASVATRWFLLDEDLMAEALAIRELMLDGRVRLVGPVVLWSEVAHAVVRAARRGRLDRTATATMTQAMRDVEPLVESIDVDTRDTVRTALLVDVSAYDAQYLALGAHLGSPVITADRRLFERGRAHGYDVAWLGDISTEDGVLVDTPQGYP